MNCPGSIREIAKLPEELRDTESVYAREGTRAHGIAEATLRRGYVILDGNSEMQQAARVYADEVFGHAKRLALPEIGIERMVYPLEDRPALFGTADCILHEPYGELVVIDYKYGKGIAVEVENNSQLLYYGLGALNAVGDDSAVSKITLVIVQPRASHPDGPIRRVELTVSDLRDFEAKLWEAANDTSDPAAPLNPGKWCRFCPAASGCPALKQLAVQTALAEFPDDEPQLLLPDENDPEQMARALKLADLIEQWPKAVKSMAFRAALKGKGPVGYKLIRGRANRKWKDGAEKAAKPTLFEKVMLSPAQAEKIDKTFVAKWAEKPDGALQLVRETDKRPAVEPGSLVGRDFPELPDETE